MDEVKQGYKQTDIGVIPEDWDIRPIGEVLRVTTGNKNTQDKKDDGIYPFFVRSQTVERINTYTFDGEGVLTAGDGVGTGKVFHYINGKFDYHQRVYLMHGFDDKVLGKYFFWFFSKYFYERINQLTAKSSVDSVRREMIADMLMPLPKKEEQTAIATALSDTDALIAALDKKIAKKQQIKQSAMQQLLTGKKRLPGFSGEWVEKRLGDDFEIYAGGDVQNAYYNDIYTQDHKYPIYSNSLIKKGLYGYTSQPRYSGNSITITGRGTVGHAEYRDTQFDAIVRLLVLKPKSNICCSLISEIINYNISFQTESTGVPQLTAPQVFNTEIYYPKSIDEQTTIAQILTDMDNEIAQLEKERDKYKDLKAGMMQVLLTGRVRLV